MAYWLMKSEPDELSIEGLGRLGETRWDGVRNYQARNFLRAMSVGDTFFPWSAVDVAHVQTLPKVLELGWLKQQAALAELPLVQKGSRLSVMPVTPEQWAAIVALS